MSPQTPSPIDSPRLPAVPPRLLHLGILGLVCALCLPNLRSGFVYDDHWTVVTNGFLRTPNAWPGLLTGAAARDHVPDAFRAMSVLVDGVCDVVFGSRAVWHHALSIALHVLVTALGVRWLGHLGAPTHVRLGTAGLFGVMAIHAEVIAVVSYREDLLAAALGLTACLAGERALRARGRLQRAAWSLGAAVFLALATSAKLSAATLPCVWWLAHRAPLWSPQGLEVGAGRPRRRVVLVTLGLIVGVALAIGHRLWTIGDLTNYGHDPSRVLAHRVGLGPVLASSIRIQAESLLRTIVPLGLSPEYVDTPASFLAAETLLCAGGSLILLGYGAWAWTRAARDPAAARIAFVVFGFAILALPTANLLPLPNMQADRYMYLPSLPIALAMVLACERLPRPLVAWTLLVAFQGSLLQSAASTYRSDTRLWTIALRRAPHSARGHAVMAELLTTPEATPRTLVAARTHCQLAARLDPHEPLAQLCAGRLAEHAHDGAAAVRHYARAAARLRDRPQRAWLGLARASLADLTVPPAARRRVTVALLERSTAAYPYDSTVWTNAGRLWHRLGDPRRAEAHYATAQRLHPARHDLWVLRVELRLDLGDRAGAASLWASRPSDLAPEALARIERRLFAAHALQRVRP